MLPLLLATVPIQILARAGRGFEESRDFSLEDPG